MLDYKLMVMVECDHDYAISAYYANLLLCHSVLLSFLAPSVCVTLCSRYSTDPLVDKFIFIDIEIWVVAEFIEE